MRRNVNNTWKLHLLSISVVAIGGVGAMVGATFYPQLALPDGVGIYPVTAMAASSPKKVGLPQRIKIPSIALDAKIENVALTKTGAMATPKDPVNAGWYQYGARPGEPGSAVIAGHVDWWNGATATFQDLHKVKVGDTITTQDDKGVSTTFVVKNIHKYNPKADATGIFISKDGKSHLNLITCAGAWDKKAKQYTERLVVFAEKQ
jgi:sortase A